MRVRTNGSELQLPRWSREQPDGVWKVGLVEGGTRRQLGAAEIVSILIVWRKDDITLHRKGVQATTRGFTTVLYSRHLEKSNSRQ